MDPNQSDSIEVVSSKVARWDEDPYSLGSWSQTRVGGDPSIHRGILGSPVSESLILAGEACDIRFPAMVNGAWDSGKRAARSICLSNRNNGSGVIEGSNEELPFVVIIGAGAAGIGAARECLDNGISNVIILEARDRIGGRAHTVSLEGTGGLAGCAAYVSVDSGIFSYPFPFLSLLIFTLPPIPTTKS